MVPRGWPGCSAAFSCNPASERGDINLVNTGAANSVDLADALAAVKSADRPWIRDRIAQSVQDMVLDETGYALHFTGDTLMALDEALGTRFAGLASQVPCERDLRRSSPSAWCPPR